MSKPIDPKEARRLVAFGIAKRWLIPATPTPVLPVGRPRKMKPR